MIRPDRKDPPKNRTIEAYDRQIADLEHQISVLSAKKSLAISRTKVRCESSVHGDGCGATLRIGDLIWLQDWWWDHGYETHRIGEGYFVCPKCGNFNRTYDREYLNERSRQFKARVDIDDEKERRILREDTIEGRFKVIGEIMAENEEGRRRARSLGLL